MAVETHPFEIASKGNNDVLNITDQVTRGIASGRIANGVATVFVVGSTAGMIDFVKTKRPRQVVMVTECSMSDNVAAESPETEFMRPCNLCPHMKRITLKGIRDSLRDMKNEVVVAPAIAARARVAVERMLAVPV